MKSLTDFNDKIQKEGKEVRRLLDLALNEKKETDKVPYITHLEFLKFSVPLISLLPIIVLILILDETVFS